MWEKVDMALNQITTIFFDVDGIFTDGSLYFSDNGINLTKFNVYDGMGCILLKETGIELLILTARHSDAVIERFKDLGINKIFTKILKKRDFIKEYSKAHNLAKKELAMMGDDLQDLAAIDEVGVFFTTPNAIDIVKDSADYITMRFGGDGAVREICDLIILSKGSSPSLEFERYIEKGI
jgi:3-deoxy-D-manno-octulosonate 8-phosphate phosphatase (KDO 8-P phosphatase)